MDRNGIRSRLLVVKFKKIFKITNKPSDLCVTKVIFGKQIDLSYNPVMESKKTLELIFKISLREMK